MDEGQQQRIGITSRQQKALEELFANAEQQRREIRSHLRDLYRELHSLDDDYNFDPQRAHALRDRIIAAEQQLLALHDENEIKLRSILNREQFQRLRAQIKSEQERHEHDRSRREGRGDRGPKNREGAPPPEQDADRKGQ